MNTFRLEIVAPDREVFSGEVEQVTLKTVTGKMGVLANHMPLVTMIDIGPVEIKADGQVREGLATGGFISVSKEKTAIVVTTFEWDGEIDPVRAQRDKQMAEDRLKEQQSQMDFERLNMKLKKAIARIELSNHW